MGRGGEEVKAKGLVAKAGISMMVVMVDGSQFPDFKPNYYTEWELLAVSSVFTLARTLIIANSFNYAPEKE